MPPDFCPITTFVPRLGIRRAVQQLGAPPIFKTLAARTRPHGGLRRARLANDTGRRARAKTAPRRAGSTRRHCSLCMRVEWAARFKRSPTKPNDLLGCYSKPRLSNRPQMPPPSRHVGSGESYLFSSLLLNLGFEPVRASLSRGWVRERVTGV